MRRVLTESNPTPPPPFPSEASWSLPQRNHPTPTPATPGAVRAESGPYQTTADVHQIGWAMAEIGWRATNVGGGVGPAGFNRTWVRRTYRLGGLIGSVDLQPADRLAESPAGLSARQSAG